MSAKYEQQFNLEQETEKEKLKTVDEHEHVIDIESPEIQKEIEKAKELFSEFFEQYKEKFDLDPSNEKAVEEVYEAAEKKGIFEQAQKIRELIYDKNISVYGVCYLSNVCSSFCTFCPIGQAGFKKLLAEIEVSKINVQQKEMLELCIKYLKEFKGFDKDIKAKLLADPHYKKNREETKRSMSRLVRHLREKKEPYFSIIKKFLKKLKILTPEEASQDMDALAEIGHQEICVLAGEELAPDPSQHKKAPRSTMELDQVAKYLQIAADKPGVKEVILNMGAYSEAGFRFIKENLRIPPGVKLQHRVFQESYDEKAYDKYMRRCEESHGTKRDWKLRYNSQVAAIKGGFDEVGIGALFGLTRYPLKEIAGLQKHAQEITEQTGKEPKRCALPIGNDPEPILNPVEIDYFIPDRNDAQKITELIYALARLSMPTISIVSSERDKPETVDKLNKIAANHTTVFVAPSPGGNINAIKELKGEHLSEEVLVAQAKITRRKPADFIQSCKEQGYNILGFDTEKYNI